MQEEQHDNLLHADGNTEATTQNIANEAIETIENLNAEASEHTSTEDSHDLPMLDYEAMDMDKLVIELEHVVAKDNILTVKDHVEEIKTAFLSKYNHFIEEKKEEFLHDNPNSTEEFEYHYPLKTKFDSLYNNFKTKKNNHFKSLESKLKENLQKRLELIEELKTLINPSENIGDNLKRFNDLRERWKNAGAIPKDKYNHVWNNFHFHVENFYDYLHLFYRIPGIIFLHL